LYSPKSDRSSKSCAKNFDSRPDAQHREGYLGIAGRAEAP
jgi:hypothetical protein